MGGDGDHNSDNDVPSSCVIILMLELQHVWYRLNWKIRNVDALMLNWFWSTNINTIQIQIQVKMLIEIKILIQIQIQIQ